MEQLRNFGDQRQVANCAHCGGVGVRTIDHTPSRVLLDEPYPEQLPGVWACETCNAAFSLDEEYLSCLIACVIAGSADPEAVSRPKARRILAEKPALAARLGKAKYELHGITHFSVEEARAKSVVLKLARGHALFELNEPHVEPPTHIACVPLSLFSVAERQAFEEAPGVGGLAAWPPGRRSVAGRCSAFSEATHRGLWFSQGGTDTADFSDRSRLFQSDRSRRFR